MSSNNLSVALNMQLKAMWKAKRGQVVFEDLLEAMQHAIAETQIVPAKEELYLQLKEINTKLKEAREGVSDVIQESEMPDSSKHLGEVLRSTEEAATAIMNGAIAIQELMNSADAALAEKVNAHIMDIINACTFQDISGQRVKKVQKTLATIEHKINTLVSSLEDQKNSVAPAKKHDTNKEGNLMSGPQLPEDTPSQDEIDKLFSTLT